MASPSRMDSLVSSDHSPRRDHLDYHHLDALQYGNEFMDYRQMDNLQNLMNNPTLAKSYSWSHSDLDLNGVIATSGVMSDDDVVPASNNSHANNLQFPPSMVEQQSSVATTGDFNHYKVVDHSTKGLLPFGSISESISTSTISSFDSVPPGLSSSVSNSFSGHSLHTDSDETAVPVLSTPVRTNSRRRSSTLTSTGPNSTLVMSTPQQSVYQTPIRRSTSFTPRRRSHARTRSRLSMDATHALGTNPFYTPPSFLSPKLESPMQQTPIDLFSSHPPASISPQMLMKQDRLATPVQEDDDNENENEEDSDSNGGIRKLRALSNYDPNLVIFQNQQPLIDTSLLSQSNSLLVDPENSESIPQRVGSITMGSVPQQTSFLQRSRSSINLSAIAASKGISRQNSFQEPTPPSTASMSSSKSTPSVKISASALVTPTNGSAPPVITPVRGHRRSKSNAPLTAEEELKAKKKIHECPICHNKFQRPEHVKRHMRSHSSEKPYACPLDDCGKKFNRKDNLKQHLRNIHGVEPPKDT